MKLEVGKKYKNGAGDVIHIQKFDHVFGYVDQYGGYYRYDGEKKKEGYNSGMSDLIEEVDTPKFEVGEEVEVTPKTDIGFYGNGIIVGFWDNAAWVYDYNLHKSTAFKIDLNRIKKLPPKMTKEEAEKKYNIRIV